MSIAFATGESKSTLQRLREERARAARTPGVTGATRATGATGARRASSPARVEANRRNARKSTGPRTAQGKRRASRNALKHGLCRTLLCLPSECEATFMTFVAELEAELRPATALQRLTFNQIASLTWRLERLPEAQTRIFEQELAKVEAADGEELKPSDVLARRFSDAPAGNGFALMERYERGMRIQLLRLMRHYEQLQRHRATTPYEPGEPPCPPEGSKPAWTEEDAKAQRAWFGEQERLHAEGKMPDPRWLRLRDDQRKLDDQARKQMTSRAMTAVTATATATARTSDTVCTAGQSASAAPRGSAGSAGDPRAAQPTSTVETAARGGAGALPRRGDEGRFVSPFSAAATERSQSKPTENPDPAQPAGKCAAAAHAPVTKRSHGDRGADGAGSEPTDSRGTSRRHAGARESESRGGGGGGADLQSS